MSDPPLVPADCCREPHCAKCHGCGRRYVPQGMTPEEFDRLYEPLRGFREAFG